MAVLPYGKSGVIGGAMLGPGPRARRDAGRRDRALGLRRRHVQPDQQRRNPSTIAANIALQFPESTRPGRQHADRQRPGAVRHHPRGQHARPLRRQPARRLLRSQLMSHRPRRRARPAPRRPRRRPSRARRGCPATAPLGLYAGRRWPSSRPARPWRGLGRRPRTSSTAVVLGTLAVYVGSRAVEGSRKATDRLVTCLVATRLRHRDGAAGLAGLRRWSASGADAPGRPVLHLLDVRRRRRGRRRLPRDHGHADHHRR